MITKRIRAFAVPAALALLASGCVAPVVEKYTAFQDKSFSARSKPAELYEGNVTDLMQHGYLLIGYTDFTHNIQICYDNFTCRSVSKNDVTVDELLKRAAGRGADRVQVLYSSLELVPKTLSVCNRYTTTTYTDQQGKVHVITVCASYSHYKGYMESWTKRALLWRHAPKLASADNNYRAVKKAFAILHHDTPKAGTAKEFNKAPINANNPMAKPDKAAGDVYGAQLVTAIGNGNFDFLKAQLDTAKLNRWQKDQAINLLMLALEMRRPSVYRWLMEKPVHWGGENRKGYGALEYAIAFAEPADVELLLSKHPGLAARFGSRDKIYRALAVARSPGMLDYLVGKGFSVNGRVGKHSLLFVAIANGNEAMVKRLLARGARVGPQSRRGLAPLDAAIIKADRPMVEALLKRGARVNAADKLGNTPLHYAAAYGTPAIVRLLLARGANVNAFNKRKYSPLYAALVAGKWKTAELFMLQRNVDYTVPGAQGFVTAMRGMLYESPASTLDMYLNTTGILYIPKLRRVSARILVACAEYCSEKKMSVFLENGVNGGYSSNGKTLFQFAYDKKNVGALVAMIRHGYGSGNGGVLVRLRQALVKGDATLVKAYRLAEVENRSTAPPMPISAMPN
ncbi:MAG: ankyrin repeat domain-containing protein [Gammaproteobacteria bacterium]